MADEERPLLDVPAAAQFAKVSERTVYRMVAAGQLPVYRVGRQLRFDEAELRERFREASGSAA